MVKLQDYRPPSFGIDAIWLDFDLYPDRTLVRSRMTMRRKAQGPLQLNGEYLELLSVKVDGRVLPASEYQVTAQHLIIDSLPESFVLEIENTNAPAANTALEGLYMSGGRFCTQCEAEGFRRITYYLDRPDVLSRFKVRVAADKTKFPTLLSNGDKIESGDLEGGRHYAVFEDPHPKPAYLFALVAGEFDTVSDRFKTMSGQDVGLYIHVDPGDGSRAAFAMDALKKSMKWDETRFNREYDLREFHIVGVRDFNYGAMENKGLNVFNSSLLLADPETSTDADYAGILRVIAHEYFHNWSGNRVTVRDWFQLCLKEGLTVYRDQEFTSDMGSRPVQRIMDVVRLREEQLPEDSGPLAHPPRPSEYQKIENFYTPTVYRKGAEVVRVLSALIGRDAFDRGMQLYFDRQDGKAATLEEFVECFEESSGRELQGFFHWYKQAGTPVLSVESNFDAAKQEFTIVASQSTAPTPGQTEKRPLPIPLKIGFIDEAGAPLRLRLKDENTERDEHEIVLESASSNFVFSGAARRPIPAILRGYQAPVTLNQKLSTADRLIQMAHDSDPFTRWEAGSALKGEAILACVDSGKLSAELLIEALRKEMPRYRQDPAFVALALQIPTMNRLVHLKSPANPEALHRAREALHASIATALEADLVEIASEAPPKAEDVDSNAHAKRSLRGSAFELLARRGATHEKLLFDVFQSAHGMTEKINALRALSAIDGGAYRDALDIFIKRHRDQPLVLDKWFAVQAALPADDAEQRVRKLANHELFTLLNPNRVRSLYATFGNANLRAFAAADGSGFRLLSEAIVAVDKHNAMTAARLARAFDVVPLLDAERRTLAYKTIRDLLVGPALSPNVTEILSKIAGSDSAAAA